MKKTILDLHYCFEKMYQWLNDTGAYQLPFYLGTAQTIKDELSKLEPALSNLNNADYWLYDLQTCHHAIDRLIDSMGNVELGAHDKRIYLSFLKAEHHRLREVIQCDE